MPSGSKRTSYLGLPKFSQLSPRGKRLQTSPFTPPCFLIPACRQKNLLAFAGASGERTAAAGNQVSPSPKGLCRNSWLKPVQLEGLALYLPVTSKTEGAPALILCKGVLGKRISLKASGGTSVSSPSGDNCASVALQRSMLVRSQSSCHRMPGTCRPMQQSTVCMFRFVA